MDDIDPKIMNKIKKCLALASSDNPHEAAAAMRQANALMEKYAVTSANITMSDIGECQIQSATMSRDIPASWEIHLVNIIGKAFGCKIIVSTKMKKNNALTKGKPLNDAQYVFVGLKHQAQVAAYAASVLIRKCKKARATFIKTQLDVLPSKGKGHRANKTRLADAFVIGYVVAITKVVHEFAMDDTMRNAIDEQVKQRTEGKMLEKVRDTKLNNDHNEQFALYHGAKAAEGESIHRPMHKNADALAIAN